MKLGDCEKMGRENDTVISEDYRKTGSSKRGENGSKGQGNWVSRFLGMKQEQWNNWKLRID